MTVPDNARPLGLRLKLLYGFGSVAFGIKDLGFAYLLLLYYNQVIGLSAALVGTAIMVALVFDAVLDPIVGQLSDYWRSSWGRRHPFMYFSALPAAIGYALLWNPPTGWSEHGLFLYLLGTSVFVRVMLTFYEIPSASLTPELTTDYDERTSLISYRSLFQWTGGILMTAMTYVVLLRPTAQYPVGQLNPVGYRIYGIIAALIMLASIIVSTISTHHRIPTLRKPPPREYRPLRDWLRDIFATLSNRSFLSMLAASLLGATSGGIVGALSLYLLTFFWKLSTAQISILLFPGLFGAWLATAVAPVISARLGKKRGAVATLALTVILMAAPILLRFAGLFPGDASPWLVPILFINGVVYATLGIAQTILIGSMFADIVEDSEVETGRRSEGLFFSATSFVAKAVSGAGVFFAGLALSIAAFPKGAKPAEVPMSVIDHLAIVYLIAVLIFQGGAVLCILLYRIDRQRHQQNLAQLQKTIAVVENATEPTSVTAMRPLIEPDDERPVARPV